MGSWNYLARYGGHRKIGRYIENDSSYFHILLPFQYKEIISFRFLLEFLSYN